MFTKVSWPLSLILLCAMSLCVGLHAQAPSQPQSKPEAQTQDQDLVEAARKAKAKKQQQQKPEESTSSAPTKPKTYTNDDVSSGFGGGSQSPSAVDHGEKPAKGKDTAAVAISLPNASIKRGTGTPVNWSVQNTSDHWMEMIVTLTVTGPCNFHTDHRIRYTVNPGGSRSDDNFNTMFYEDQCPGEYTFALRAEAARQVLSSTSTTLTVR